MTSEAKELSGRDLDHQVWIALFDGCEHVAYPDELTRGVHQCSRCGCAFSDQVAEVLNLPAYSSTWDGAGKVVEAMQAKGYAVAINGDRDWTAVQFANHALGHMGFSGREHFAEA